MRDPNDPFYDLTNLRTNRLDQSSYNFNYRVFPLDLTMEDNNHYMILNINVPVGYDDGSRSNYNGPKYRTSILDGEFSKVDTLKFGNYMPEVYSPGNDRSTTGLRVNQRYTRRIQESIALHMPNGGLVFTEDNKYQEISMTSVAGATISTLARGGAGLFSDKLQSAVGSIFGDIGSAIQKAGQIAGMPINPSVEVLFATRPQRQWVFEVFMMPRSKEEADTVKEIIKTIRYHAAPELDPVTSGFSFVPPAEFDITFFRGGKENLNLPRINTCALQRIDIDYAPQQDYSVFEDGGYPVAVRMSLSFVELELLHKQRVLQGF